jgi:transcriptional regulator with XRE-family HTH domain
VDGELSAAEVAVSTGGPGFVRRQLGRRLRQLREESGRTIKSIEDARIFSQSKVQRLEGGKAVIKVGDVLSLCRFYGASHQLTDLLATMAEASSQEGWWEEQPGVVAEFARMYVALESSCTAFKTYHPELIHGLLQTQDFARHVSVAGEAEDERVVEGRLKLFRERQQVVGRPGRDLRFVFGPGVLQLRVGSDAVMTKQFAHLREVSTRPGVDIRILPGKAGPHPGLFGRFTLMEFEDPDDPSVAYLESLTGARYVETPRQVQQYREAFQAIYELSSPIEEFLP